MHTQAVHTQAVHIQAMHIQAMHIQATHTQATHTQASCYSHHMRHIALIFALSAAATGVAAQPVYKCGSTYSQEPCAPGAHEIKIHRPPLDPNSLDGMRTRWAAEDVQRAKTGAALAEIRDKQRLAALSDIDNASPLNPPTAAQMALNENLCKAEIVERMKDPDTVKFRGFRRSPKADVSIDSRTGMPHAGVSYYIDVNGKNSYGGYTGFKASRCVFNLKETLVLYSE